MTDVQKNKKSVIPEIERFNKLAEMRHRLEVTRLDMELTHFEKHHRVEKNRTAHFGRPVPYVDGDLIRRLLSENGPSVESNSPSTDESAKRDELKTDDGVIREFQDLFMTGGEVDLDKVLCLHVFSTRQAFSCSKAVGDKKVKALTPYGNLLPSYLIDEDNHNINCTCWKRQSTMLSCDSHPIQIHLSINVKISKLLKVVVSTLKLLNESKLKILAEDIQSVEKIAEVLNRSTSLEFLKFLLKSDLMTSESNYKTRICTLVRGSTRRVQDVAKFQKNLVFRIPAPKMLRSVFIDIVEYFGEDNESTVSESVQSYSDLISLRKIFEKEKTVRRVFGYKVLQHRSNRSGILVLNRVGASIAYLRGPGDAENCSTPNEFINNLNILMEDPDQAEMVYESDKLTIEEEISSLRKEVISLIKIAKKHASEIKKRPSQVISQFEKITSNFFNRLPDAERLRLTDSVARQRSDETSLAELVKQHVSRNSILNVVETSTVEERNGFLFKSPDDGGLGLAESLLNASDVNKMMILARMPSSGKDFALINRLTVESKEGDFNEATDDSGIHHVLKIKQKLYQSELDRKFKDFIQKDFSKS